MKINPEDEERILELIDSGEKFRLEFSGRTIQDLHNCLRALIKRCHWGRNIEIINKKGEKERFLEKIEQGEDFKPEFRFREFSHNPEQLLEILESCREEAEEITESNLDRYGAEKIDARTMQEFYREIFHELQLYVKLASGIEQEDCWKKISEKIWPMVEEDTFEESRDRMKELETGDLEKNLDSSDLKEMFEKEIERLGMKYSVEIREVPGCFNIPEEKTVVVADGSKGEKRYYSNSEARMLTCHELFHSVRAYNGYKASKRDLPPILAIHTPFYDRTEEGGALYREHRTGAAYNNKNFDHHLRLVTAYRMAESDDFREDFHDITQEIINLGADPERVFELMARNREVLRHHIYKAGYREWKDLGEDEVWPLLIGKINQEYAEVFREEVEADGMFQEPEIGAEKLFDFTFKDSE